MTSSSELGGRLALLQPADLTPDQRQLYDQLQNTEIPWAEKSGFQAQTAAKQLIGPFNPMLYSPAIATAMMGLTSALSQHSALPEPVRQVVILTVGAGWQAAYELYAHTAVAHKAGLTEEAIRALAAGQPPVGLSAAEALVHEFTRQLTTTHQIGPDLYQQATETFGEKGLFDMVLLAGQYMTVSALLNAFAIPAPTAS